MTWLDEAEARCKAATEGPWIAVGRPRGRYAEEVGRCNYWRIETLATPFLAMLAELNGADSSAHTKIGDDAALIAAARTDLPEALRLLREAVALLEEADLGDPGPLHDRHAALLAAIEKGPGR